MLRLLVKRHGFWFVDIPRTSSSSIKSELGQHFGRAYGKKHLLEKQYSTPQLCGVHIPAQEMRILLGESIWNEIFTFTMVRNPWERILSMYHYRTKASLLMPTEWSFRDYVLALKTARSDTKFFEYHAHRYGAAEYILGAGGGGGDYSRFYSKI